MQELRKTRIKSIRLDAGKIEALGKAARRAHMTESAFLSDILETRLISDPLVPAFQEITLSADTFQSILSATNVDALEAAASDIAQRNMSLIRELYEGYGRKLNLKAFVTDVLQRHAHWFYIEGDINLTHGWVTLRHRYGLKWSKFIRAYLLSAYSTFSKGKLDMRIGDQFVRISFTTGHEEIDDGHEMDFLSREDEKTRPPRIS